MNCSDIISGICGIRVQLGSYDDSQIIGIDGSIDKFMW